MPLDKRQKKLFDDAYTEYLKIVNVIEELHRNAIDDPFEKRSSSVTDLVCSLDLYLQGILLKTAAAGGDISAEEIEFISSLPDEFDEVCARNRGYARFIRNATAESLRESADKYFDDSKLPWFLKYIMEEKADEVKAVTDCIAGILKNFAAVKDSLDTCEDKETFIRQTVNGLREKTAGINLKPDRQQASSGGLDTAADERTAEADGRSAEADGQAFTADEELQRALDELNELIGLDSVKKEVLAAINLIKVNNMRKEKGLPELQISRHMVFAGSPGTGKTTVARIIAKIYRALGVVSNGQLVETDRSGMVAGYIGQTALKTAKVIREARGGVLFIDEAYSLASGGGMDSQDFGKEAVDTLVKEMEDNRDDLVVIAAGYTDEMKRFINMNPGLKSRFSKYIIFDNYTADEMFRIFRLECTKLKYILDEGAKRRALEYFKCHQEDEQFGNARGVRNYLERAILTQASRVAMIDHPGEKELRTLLEEDLE